MQARTKIFEETLETVIEVTEIPKEDILGPSREADVCIARKLFFYTLRKKGLRVTSICRMLKLRGCSFVSSTIVKNYQTAEALVKKKDDEFTELLYELKKGI